MKKVRLTWRSGIQDSIMARTAGGACVRCGPIVLIFRILTVLDSKFNMDASVSRFVWVVILVLASFTFFSDSEGVECST